MANDHFDIVKLIADNIDEKHPKDCRGFSPFKLAAYHLDLEMIKFLEESCGIFDEESKASINSSFSSSKIPRLEYVWKN